MEHRKRPPEFYIVTAKTKKENAACVLFFADGIFFLLGCYLLFSLLGFFGGICNRFKQHQHIFLRNSQLLDLAGTAIRGQGKIVAVAAAEEQPVTGGCQCAFYRRRIQRRQHHGNHSGLRQHHVIL